MGGWKGNSAAGGYQLPIVRFIALCLLLKLVPIGRCARLGRPPPCFCQRGSLICGPPHRIHQPTIHFRSETALVLGC